MASVFYFYLKFPFSRIFFGDCRAITGPTRAPSWSQRVSQATGLTAREPVERDLLRCDSAGRSEPVMHLTGSYQAGDQPSVLTLPEALRSPCLFLPLSDSAPLHSLSLSSLIMCFLCNLPFSIFFDHHVPTKGRSLRLNDLVGKMPNLLSHFPMKKILAAWCSRSFCKAM